MGYALLKLQTIQKDKKNKKEIQYPIPKMLQSKLSRDGTFIKIRTQSKLNPQANITSVAPSSSNNKYTAYKFNNRGQVILPLQEFIIFRNGSQIAQIDVRPIAQYPQHQHHIHTQSYNQKLPFSKPDQVQLVMTFNQIPQQYLAQGIPLKIVFVDAEITHDTETFSKMDPYVRVKLNDVDKWRSKTVKKGDKFPNFNRESTNLNVKSLNDYVGVQLWDDDMRNDDFIGGATIRASQLIGRGQQVLEFPIAYNKKDKIVAAGKVRFQVQSPNLT